MGFLTISRFLPWIAAILIGVGIGGWGVHRVSVVPAKEKILRLELQVEAEKLDTEAARQANETNMEAIAALKSQIDEMVEARRVEAARNEAEIQRRTSEATAAKKEADRLRREVTSAWGVSRSCEAFRDSRVDDACPDVAVRLRERSAYPDGG